MKFPDIYAVEYLFQGDLYSIAGQGNAWRKTNERVSCFIQMGLDMLWFPW